MKLLVFISFLFLSSITLIAQADKEEYLAIDYKGLTHKIRPGQRIKVWTTNTANLTGRLSIIDSTTIQVGQHRILLYDIYQIKSPTNLSRGKPIVMFFAGVGLTTIGATYIIVDPMYTPKAFYYGAIAFLAGGLALTSTGLAYFIAGKKFYTYKGAHYYIRKEK